MSRDDDALFGQLPAIQAAIDDPTRGLPMPVFDFVRQVTPMINVDLLVRNARGETLLAWREDAFHVGWHVPGGIIRFREPAHARIAHVARGELGAEVEAEAAPCDVLETLDGPRGHFISLLYRCTLRSDLARGCHREGQPRDVGVLRWFARMPDDIVDVHRPYGRWFDR